MGSFDCGWVLLNMEGVIQVPMQQRYLFVILRIWG